MKQWLDSQLTKDFELEEVKKLGGRLYDFVDRKSKKLLVTVGDSWTYGARLAEESNNSDQFRIDNCFGNLISKEYNIDFLNLSVQGINNLWMIDKLKFLDQAVSDLHYEKVCVLITFTEYGRELNTDFDTDPSLNDLYRSCMRPRDLAVALAEHASNQILQCNDPRISVVLATNYVNNLYPQSIQEYFLPMSWLEILRGGQAFKDECTVVGSWVIPKYKEILDLNSHADQNQILIDLEAMIDSSQKRITEVYNTGYNHKVGYGHPNSHGHRLWANYCLTNLATHDFFQN